MRGQSYKDMVDKYVYYLKASDRGETAIKQVCAFYRWCKKRFPDCLYLSQDMVNKWWVKSDTENHITYRSRAYRVLPFLRYVNDVLAPNTLVIPQVPQYVEPDSVPHYFTEEELKQFFASCDNLPTNNTLSQKLRKMVVPVIFRLLYSSGLRVKEARLLNRSDVDFITGIVTIRQTKGYIEHFIVLHDNMRELLVIYDNCVDRLLSNRKTLFPDENDWCHKNKWLSDQFRKCWYTYNKSTAYARELRHQYAIENINSWHNEEYETYDRLVALKNSMGHTKLSRTLYYYALVPQYSDLIETKCGDTFNEVIPLINLDEDEDENK